MTGARAWRAQEEEASLRESASPWGRGDTSFCLPNLTRGLFREKKRYWLFFSLTYPKFNPKFLFVNATGASAVPRLHPTRVSERR